MIGHSRSSNEFPSRITQFNRRWLVIWLLPLILSAFCVGIAHLLDWEDKVLYAVQAALLSTPNWAALLWVFWSIWVAWKTKKAWLFGIALLPQLSVLPGMLERTPPGFTVLIANVNAFSGQTNQLQHFLSSQEVDAIVQIEKRVNEIPSFTRVADDFEPELPRVSHHIGVYCKAPQDCAATVSPQIGSASMAMSYATLRIKPDLCLVAVHAPPPVPIDASGMRPYIEHLVQHIDDGRIITELGACKQGDTAVVAGDFNAVAGSWPHRTLLARGLKDRLWMRGLWANTWPMEGHFFPFPVFRIDHLLTPDALKPAVTLMTVPASDHRALKITFP